jgi:hypothetical protein
MGSGYNMFIEQKIWRDSFEAAAFRIAVMQEMKKSGFSVSEKTINKEVARQFIDDGKFSQALYDRYDNNSRLNMWRRTQDDIAVRRYYSDMESLQKPLQAVEFITGMSSRMRSFNFVNFPVYSYPDAEIISYAEKNAGLFRQTHLSRITILSNEREAKQILKSIKDGNIMFEDAARAHSQDSYSERGGDMGSKPVYELRTEIPGEAEREQVLTLEKDELSNVIKLENSWVIFRAEEAVQTADLNDPAILDRVRSYIQTFERSKMEDWAIEEADKFIMAVNEKGFDTALDENGLNSRSFGPIPINYGDVDLFGALSSASIQELSESSRDENFWKTAFGTSINTPSAPLVQGENIIVLFPTSEEEADESAIEAIKSNYSDNWLPNTNDESMRSFFFNSSKMEDNFLETFMQYLSPRNE